MSVSIVDSNTEVTEQLAREIRQWSPRDAADFYFKKSREIESRMQHTFLEFGIVLNEIEKRELYREMPRLSCPVCKLKVEWNHGRCPYCDTEQDTYTSFDRFLIEACPIGGKTSGYSAKRCIEAAQEAGIPLERLERIPRGNLEVVAQEPSVLMRSPEIMDAAETMTNVAFVGKVVKDHPELHFERKIKLVFRPTASAYAVEMRALDLVGRLLSINDRDSQLEAMAADFLGEHDEATQADQQGI